MSGAGGVSAIGPIFFPSRGVNGALVGYSVQRRDLEELVNAYVAPLVLLLALLACIALVYLVSLWLAPTRRVLCAEPFMAGHDPREHASSRFHARWYAVCLLFLAFDMEMVFMYPWAVVFAQTGFKALVEMGLFLLILVIGVFHAWREGALRWT
jgi:NADH-quinone oxidoreductase subunit A